MNTSFFMPKISGKEDGEGFTMPDTGSSEVLILSLLLILYITASAYSIIILYKKREW